MTYGYFDGLHICILYMLTLIIIYEDILGVHATQSCDSFAALEFVAPHDSASLVCSIV